MLSGKICWKQMKSSSETSTHNASIEQVSFSQLAAIYYSAKTNLLSRTDDQRKEDKDRYPKVRALFESNFGKIQKEYFGDTIVSAAILTEKGYLSAIHNTLKGGYEAELIFQKCCNKGDEVYRLFENDDRYWSNDEHYSVIARIIEYFDLKGKTGVKDSFELTTEELDQIKSLFDQANSTFERISQKVSKIQYVKGMLIGTCLTLVFIAAVAIILYSIDLKDLQAWTIPLALLSGVCGTVVSVFQRMTFGKLSLDFYSGKRLLTLFGGFRVIIGAILGLAIYSLVRAGLLPIKIPENSIDMLYFSSAISFLAGFGERWAQDMLTRTQKMIAGKPDQVNNTDKTSNNKKVT